MPPVSAFDAMSRDEARRWMQVLGIPRIAGGEETPEEKAAREKADADKAEADRLKAEDDERKALGDAGKRALDAEREAKRKEIEKARAANDRATAAEKAVKEAQDKLDAIEKAKGDAETERLKKAGEFEKLATDAEAKAATLQSQLDALTAERDELKKTADAVAEANQKRWDEGVKALPETMKPLIPKDSMPLADRLEWLEAAQKAGGDDKGRNNGNGRNPRKREGGGADGADAVARNAQANYSG